MKSLTMSQYRIKTVSKITNIPIDTIRNWEKRYSFLKPYVGTNGEKVYSDNDIDLLRKVTVLLKTGGRISEIASKVLDNTFLDQIDDAIKISNEVQLMIEDYYQFLLETDLKKIDQIENLIEITVIFKNRIEFIYYPLLDRARKDCALGVISFGQEHFVTGHILNKLKGFLSTSVFNHDLSKCSIICSTPSNSVFEGGLLALACGMKLRGYNIYYLGSNLPVGELKSFANKIQPAVISISIHSPHELAIILELYKEANYPVCVGGLGVRLSDVEQSKHGSVNLISYTGIQAVEKLESISLEYYQDYKRNQK